MREVFFETDNAILKFYYDDVLERLPYYESTLGAAEATTLCELLTGPDHSIKVPKQQYRFAYFALYLIEQGKGVVYCKACKRYYEAKDLKRAVVGHGESPFSVNVKRRGLWKRLFRRKDRLPLLGGKGYQCPVGRELISAVTWRT